MAKVSKEQLFELAISGAITAVGYADVLLNRAIRKYGYDKQIQYPDTGYELPCFYGWTKTEIKKLGDLPPLLGEVRSKIKHEPTYENALIAGEATMWAAEIVENLKYIENTSPYADTPPYGKTKYCGFVSDVYLRKLGIAFVDDTIPGTLVLVGKAKDPKALAKLIRDAQNKGMLLWATYDIVKQVDDLGINMGLDIMFYPIGEFTQIIHALNFAIRAALAFGGIKRGDREGIYNYLSKRPKAVVIHLGPLDQIKVAAEFAVLFHGSPTITDQDVEEIPGKYVSQPDYDQIISTAIEIRDMKIKLAAMDLPVAYGPAFEGESIRKKDMYVEAGGTRSKSFELVRMMPADKVQDGKIEFIGKEVDEFEEGSAIPLGIVVDIYGRKMQKDFESVFERRIHQFINFIEGGWHTGQRNLNWIRMSKAAVKAGLRLKDFGKVLHTRFHSDFGEIVNRVQILITTDEETVKKYLPEAMEAYKERDKRISGLTDETVDTFYTCTLCQSFAPNHVCIITPERLGLCGAINWLDAKASKEITPTGPNQPIKVGDVIDRKLGIWNGVNDAVRQYSHGNVEIVSLYSIMANPMTSCGCFECILAIVPEVNGVMVVNREYAGDTPIGIKFSTLAGSVGGGNITPGFLGVGRRYLVSKKFIAADGGFHRLVWMPKMLKDSMYDLLKARAEELGTPDFVDKIADETIAVNAQDLLKFLEKMKHPALTMPPLL